MKVLPMPLGEAQAAIVARIWSNRLSLPTRDLMLRWEEERLQRTGGSKGFHIMGRLEDLDYHNELFDWAKAADLGSNPVMGLEPPPCYVQDSTEDRSDSARSPKLPKRWTEEDYWLRSKMADLRKAFADRGEARFQVRTIEDLGFDFEKEKSQQQLGESCGKY
jgi:hypothetical protein